MSIPEFNSMGLKSDLLTMINKKGFDEPTPIQVKTIPLVMAGFDIIGQAQTGTGKTAAFGLPILNQITKGAGTQALVLCPTRELAVQVSKEILFLGHLMQIRSLPIYGGQSIERQIQELKRGPEIVVATTGRLLDHMRRKTISLSELQFVVIDEADEMLDMGFFPDIEMVLKSCPTKRQTLLFSATLAPEVRSLGTRFLTNSKIVAIPSTAKNIPEIDQSYYKVNPAFKIESIDQIMRMENPAISLVFCRTRKGVDKLARRLKMLGHDTDALHGDMSQRERDMVMHRFRNKKTKVLIATDIAARGLDISHVTHVFNYDIPEDCEGYVHRIGRTGRAGKTGTAITLVEPDQFRHLRAIERFTGKPIAQESLGSAPNKTEFLKTNLDNRLKNLNQQKPVIYEKLAKELLQKYDTEDLVTSLITLVLGEFQEAEIREFKETRQVRKSPPPIKPREVREIKEVDIVNIEIPIGKRSVKNKRQLIDYILTNTSLSETQIGEIEIEDSFTIIEIPMKKVDEVYNAFSYFKSGWSKVNKEEHYRPRVPISK
ncbi:MAG TPA: DEAD/DEAH box helicase [Syntrophomonadaceae bacterium]|nr:DEAD/DEAH box helicase [Syntrophomonadaceae bacterium]